MSEVFGVHGDDLQSRCRFFKEWKDQRKLIEQLESEVVRLRTSGGGNDTTDVDGVRIVVMEIEGDMKSMTTMLKELTLDPSADGGRAWLQRRRREIVDRHHRKHDCERAVQRRRAASFHLHTHPRGWRRTPHVCARRWVSR